MTSKVGYISISSIVGSYKRKAEEMLDVNPPQEVLEGLKSIEDAQNQLNDKLQELRQRDSLDANDMDFMLQNDMDFMLQHAALGQEYTMTITWHQENIKAIKNRLINKIEFEAEANVRKALREIATEESYDLVHDASALAFIGTGADDLGPRVLARLTQG